jgi:hypothetical protein
MARDEESTVIVFSPVDVVEAQAVQGILEEAGIKVLVRPYQDDMFPFSGGPMTAATWGEVSVLEADEEQALEIIAAYLKDIEGSS